MENKQNVHIKVILVNVGPSSVLDIGILDRKGLFSPVCLIHLLLCSCRRSRIKCLKSTYFLCLLKCLWAVDDVLSNLQCSFFLFSLVSLCFGLFHQLMPFKFHESNRGVNNLLKQLECTGMTRTIVLKKTTTY